MLALVSDEAGAAGGTSGLGDTGVLLKTGPKEGKGGGGAFFATLAPDNSDKSLGGAAFIAGGGAFIGGSARTGASLRGVANVDGNDGGDTAG